MKGRPALLTLLNAALTLSICGSVLGQHPNPYGPGQYTFEVRTRGASDLRKLSPALQQLYTYYTIHTTPRYPDPGRPRSMRMSCGSGSASVQMTAPQESA